MAEPRPAEHLIAKAGRSIAALGTAKAPQRGSQPRPAKARRRGAMQRQGVEQQ